MTRYRWIDARKAEGFPVVAACRTAEVSASSFYEWAAKVASGPGALVWDEAALVNEIIDDAFQASSA